MPGGVRTRSGWRCVTLLVAMVVLLTACSTKSKSSGVKPTVPGGGNSPTTQEAKTLKIGASLSLTGNLAAEAKLTKSGYDLWADEVNKRGGIKVGNDHYKVQMTYLDDESSADQSAQLTERLITGEKVDFLFSPYGSGLVFASSAISERHRKIMINAGGTAGNIYSRNFKYFFSAWNTGALYTSALFELIPKLDPKPQSIAVLWKNDLGNREATAPIVERAAAAGLKVVYNESFNPGTTDFSTAIAVIKKTNPDIMVFASQQAEFVAAIRQMKAADLQPKILFNTVAVTLPDFPKIVGQDAEALVGASWFIPSVNFKDTFWGDTKTYVKMFRDKYGTEPDYHAEIGSVAGVLLAAALEKAGSIETEAVRTALVGLDLETISGRVQFDPDGKNKHAQMILGQIQNGTFTPVYPKVEGAGTLRYPKPAWK